MRWLLILSSALLLAGCAQLTLTNVKVPGLPEDRAAAGQRYRQEIEAGRPLLQVGVLKDKTSTIAVQRSQRAGITTYASPDGVALLLKGPLLFGTKGLGGDILSSDVDQAGPLIQSRTGGVATRFHTMLDGENQAVTRTYVCVIENEGPREIDVGTLDGGLRKVQTILMQEDCKSLNQEFTNLYWVARGSSRVLQSRQWTGETKEGLLLRVILP